MKEAYPDDHNMVLHALIYLAYDVQYSKCNETLWGAKIWDPYHIAATMGVAHKTLINKIKPERRRELASVDPAGWDDYLEKKKTSGYPLWDTALCNAIYLLMEQTKIEKYQSLDKEDKVAGLRRLQILDHAEKRRSARNKILYEVKYSKSFMTNLVKNFTRFDLDLLVKLPPASRVLYLGIMNGRDMAAYKEKQDKANELKMTVEFSPAINTLFKWINSKQAHQREGIRELKTKLNQINEIEKTISQRKDDETPYISYSLENYIPRFSIQYSRAELAIRDSDNKDRFNQIFLINLKTTYRDIYREKIRQMESAIDFYWAFSEWLENLNTDIDPKMKGLEETYLMVYGNTTHYDKNRWDQYKTIPELRFRFKSDYFKMTKD